MDTASRILIAGGVFNLAYGFATGIPLTIARARSPNASKYLVFAHVGPLMQGPMLLALTAAVALSPLSAAWETAAAWMLVGGSAALAFKDTLNWLQGIKDEFKEKPPGFAFGAISAVLSVGGLGILIVGVCRAL
jgi:hypothetical protein